MRVDWNKPESKRIQVVVRSRWVKVPCHECCCYLGFHNIVEEVKWRLIINQLRVIHLLCVPPCCHFKAKHKQMSFFQATQHPRDKGGGQRYCVCWWAKSRMHPAVSTWKTKWQREKIHHIRVWQVSLMKYRNQGSWHDNEYRCYNTVTNTAQVYNEIPYSLVQVRACQWNV